MVTDFISSSKLCACNVMFCVVNFVVKVCRRSVSIDKSLKCPKHVFAFVGRYTMCAWNNSKYFEHVSCSIFFFTKTITLHYWCSSVILNMRWCLLACCCLSDTWKHQNNGQFVIHAFGMEETYKSQRNMCTEFKWFVVSVDKKTVTVHLSIY